MSKSIGEQMLKTLESKGQYIAFTQMSLLSAMRGTTVNVIGSGAEAERNSLKIYIIVDIDSFLIVR